MTLTIWHQVCGGICSLPRLDKNIHGLVILKDTLDSISVSCSVQREHEGNKTDQLDGEYEMQPMLDNEIMLAAREQVFSTDCQQRQGQFLSSEI